MTVEIAGVAVPDSLLATQATELVHDNASPVLFDHSRRVYFFAGLQGRRLRLAFDPELLYVGAMFHDLGLTPAYRNSQQRFELDGADQARRFLVAHGLPESSIRVVWEAIALHTTPAIPYRLEAEVALLTAGVETDVLGVGYQELDPADIAAVVGVHPRLGFKSNMLAALCEGMRHRPHTTFGTANADILRHFLPEHRYLDLVTIIEGSAWPD